MQAAQNAVKQAYSREIVKAGAKARGWKVKQDEKNPNKFVVVKAGFGR